LACQLNSSARVLEMLGKPELGRRPEIEIARLSVLRLTHSGNRCPHFDSSSRGFVGDVRMIYCRDSSRGLSRSLETIRKTDIRGEGMRTVRQPQDTLPDCS
jgi:hypothetical protein